METRVRRRRGVVRSSFVVRPLCHTTTTDKQNTFKNEGSMAPSQSARHNRRQTEDRSTCPPTSPIAIRRRPPQRERARERTKCSAARGSNLDEPHEKHQPRPRREREHRLLPGEQSVRRVRPPREGLGRRREPLGVPGGNGKVCVRGAARGTTHTAQTGGWASFQIDEARG